MSLIHISAAVSGVNVNTEASEPTLRWNALDNVNRYEILVKDSAGREYVSSASLKDDGTVDKTYYLSLIHICGDGCCGTCFFKMGTGGYGNTC